MLNVNRLRLPEPYRIPTHLLVAQVASALLFLVGNLVLIGWWFDIEVLKNGFSGSPGTMKANTALCFVLSGVSLWLSLRTEEEREKGGEGDQNNYSLISPPLLVSKMCAAVITIIAVLTLSQYLFGWNLGIDELLFYDSPISATTSHPGRMGLNTALNFILVARALELLIDQKTERSSWYAQILSLIATLVSLQVLIGYVYQVKFLYGMVWNTTSMALHIALLFIVLGIGILWVRAEQGLMRIVISDTYGGLLARRLLVAAIAVPFGVGWLIVAGQRAGKYDPAFAISVFAIVLIVIFVVLIWQSAAVIEQLSSQRDISDGLRQSAQEALRVYEDKLGSFVDANVIGILFADVHGGIQQANDEFLRMIGYTREDLLAGKISWKDITPTEYLYLDEQKISEAKANTTGACTPYEKEYICKDGSRVPVLVGYVLLGENKEESVAFILDLSERQAALRDRQQAEERILQLNKDLQRRITELQTLLEVIPIGIGIAEDPECRTIKINPAFGKQLGIPPDINASLTAPSEERPTSYKVYHQGKELSAEELPMQYSAANGVEVLDSEIDVVRENHKIVSLLVRVAPLFDEEGKTRGSVGAFLDITERKQVEKALSLGYKRLQLLFGIASDLLSSQQPVALLDNVFQKLAEQIGLDVYFNYLVDGNSQVMQLMSYSGISLEQAKQIESLVFGQAICGTAAQQHHPIAVENVQQSTDPKTELIRSLGVKAYYACPLMAQGRLLGTLSFGSRTRLSFTDNQKGMMQAVCDQIAIAMERSSLIASLQQQTEQLREANRMKDEFLAILSHELRSPLNAILGWAQLLHSRKLSEAQIARAVETIERNARMQTQLVEDLLDISRIIRGKLRLNVRSCALVPIIQSAIETVSLAAQVKEIDLKFSVKINNENQEYLSVYTEKKFLSQTKDITTKFLVYGDAERLQQIIWNLLSNAIKFTPNGGAVEIKLSTTIANDQKLIDHNKAQSPLESISLKDPSHLSLKEDSANLPITNYAQIEVIDTGIGISADFLPYVFDRFRQADSSSTRPYGGLGLGLAIVRHLVELHGGTIDADSSGEEQGATFTVRLPLLKSKHSTVNSPSPSPPLALPPSLLGVRVLVVDDEADSREFITTVLEQYQAEVQAVASVKEALQVIPQWKPDVLVSDIGMPCEDGYSLIRKLRSQPPEQGGNIPAAALTAYARVEDRMRAIQEGYQIHLPKPIEPAELATVVASLVKRT